MTKSSVTEDRIAVCIPVWYAPNFPQLATYSNFVEVACPDCKQMMWLGERIKALVTAENIPMMCAMCATKKYPDLGKAKIRTLSDEDN